MSIRASQPGRARRVVSRAPSLAIFLAALAVICLALAPLGWRLGLLPLKVAFLFLSAGGLLGIAAGIVAAFGLIIAWRSLGWLRIAALAGALLLGIAFVGVSWRLRHSHLPPINDITTDTGQPPAFVAAEAARQAEHAVPDAYGGPAVAEQQKAAYPDIAPAILALPPAKAFDLALATAKAMPGWQVIATDSQAGRIEATQSSFWFGFVDDIAIRVAADAGGSRIDMRSHSRLGRGDLGVNAARVRSYMAALKRAAG